MREFKLPALYAIVNVDTTQSPVEFVERIFSAGATLLQLRNKSLPDNEFLQIAKVIRSRRDEIESASPLSSARALIINDSIEICRLSGADGVHLGQEDKRPETARAALGPEAVIGFSTHSLQQVVNAPCAVLSYLAVGPIFTSPTKSGHAPEVGTEELAKICSEATLPLVAIGGITAKNCFSVFEAGAASVAMISELEKSSDLAATLLTINANRERSHTP